jgi:hypothetical protein
MTAEAIYIPSREVKSYDPIAECGLMKCPAFPHLQLNRQYTALDLWPKYQSKRVLANSLIGVHCDSTSRLKHWRQNVLAGPWLVSSIGQPSTSWNRLLRRPQSANGWGLTCLSNKRSNNLRSILVDGCCQLKVREAIHLLRSWIRLGNTKKTNYPRLVTLYLSILKHMMLSAISRIILLQYIDITTLLFPSELNQ